MTADAIVVLDRSRTAELAFRAKRAGQLAPKTRFHAAQLDAYLTDGLWLRNATHAGAMAVRLRAGLKAIPEVGLLSAAADIVFCRLLHRITEALLTDGYVFPHDRWEPGVVRFVTSFATTPQDVDGLLADVRRHAARSPAAG